MKTWGLYLTSVFVTLSIVAFVGLEVLYRWRVRPILEKDRATQAKYRMAYQDDTSFVEKAGIYPTVAAEVASDSKKDAGPLLNKKLFWTPIGAKKFGADRPLVDAPMREWLIRMGSDWTSLATKKRKTKTDLSFFSDLAGFEYWDIERQSPIEALTQATTFVPPSKISLPDANDIIALSKLRLAQGSMMNQPLVALREVRKLAELLMTTENLQLTMTGLALLDHERRAYNFFVNERQIKTDDWKPVDRNITRRAHRALIASPGYLRLWTDADILQKDFIDHTPPGFCATVNEALPFEFSLRGLLEPEWPLEHSLASEYERLDRVFLKARSQCRLRYLTKLVEANRFAEDVPGPVVLNRLPYARKVFGMRLSTANFSGFDGYGQAAKSQAAAGHN